VSTFTAGKGGGLFSVEEKAGLLFKKKKGKNPGEMFFNDGWVQPSFQKEGKPGLRGDERRKRHSVGVFLLKKKRGKRSHGVQYPCPLTCCSKGVWSFTLGGKKEGGRLNNGLLTVAEIPLVKGARLPFGEKEKKREKVG